MINDLQIAAIKVCMAIAITFVVYAYYMISDNKWRFTKCRMIAVALALLVYGAGSSVLLVLR